MVCCYDKASRIDQEASRSSSKYQGDGEEVTATISSSSRISCSKEPNGGEEGEWSGTSSNEDGLDDEKEEEKK